MVTASGKSFISREAVLDENRHAAHGLRLCGEVGFFGLPAGVEVDQCRGT
jgi:hypothetical protein